MSCDEATSKPRKRAGTARIACPLLVTQLFVLTACVGRNQQSPPLGTHCVPASTGSIATAPDEVLASLGTTVALPAELAPSESQGSAGAASTERAAKPASTALAKDCDPVHFRGMAGLSVFNGEAALDDATTRVTPRVSVKQFLAPDCKKLEAGCQPLLRIPVVANLGKAQQRELDQEWQDLLAAESNADDCWLSFYDFVVHHDGAGILSLTVRYSGWGSRPSMSMRSFNFKAYGEPLRILDVLLPGGVEPVLGLIRKRQAAAVAEARVGLDKEDLTQLEEQLKLPSGQPNRFEARHLEQFVVEAKGLRFYYHFGFHYALEALTPLGEYFVSYEELRPYIDPLGPLGWALAAHKSSGG